MWRKLFIACLFGVLSWKTAEAGAGTPSFPGGDDIRIESEAAGSPGSAARRIALVLGNEHTPDHSLASPVNDARAVGKALAALGFEVILHENLSKAGMEGALADFERRLAPGGLGLFYFAGHGFQSGDATLLASIDADVRMPHRLSASGIALQAVLRSMSAQRPGRQNLVILDACLANPFEPRAAAPLRAPARTIIATAAAPGKLAIEGERHGVYTAALLDAIAVPGRTFKDVLDDAAAAVIQRTGERQHPQAIYSPSADKNLVLADADGQVRQPPLAAIDAGLGPVPRFRAILPKDSAEQYELAFWDSIKDSKHAADYEAYLQAYPKGRFAALAKARMERLRAAAPKAETPAPERAPSETKAPPERPRQPPAAKSTPEREKPPEKKEPPPAAVKESPKPASPPAAATPAPSTAERSSGGGSGSSNGRVAEIKDCDACPVLVSLPGGSFTMGSNGGDPSEKPAHPVHVDAPFAIGKFEVTVGQWNACAEGGGCPRIASAEKQPPATPIRDLSWDDAQQYVKWLTKLSGKPYRLPTEAEWEFAARGGTSSRFWWGEQMRPGSANCKDCGGEWSQDGPANVGSFAPNPFGLHDVNGSVWEWVSDCWHNSYKGAPGDGRSWDAPGCRDRVIRGGSWRDGASYMPSSTRFKYSASVRHSQNGFRVARDLK